MRPRYRFVVGAVIVAAVLLALLGSTLRRSTVYYLTIEELQSQTPDVYGQRVRVAGLVDRGSVDWQQGSSVLRFSMVDGEMSLPVTYEGLVPDAFAQTDSVVVEGEYGPDSLFRADVLVVQCPSKYESELTE